MTHLLFGDGTKGSRFRLGAPSMIYGKDLRENVKRLAKQLDHVEIVLFQTPDLHNLPDEQTLTLLEQIGEEKGLTYSIHLPTSLEIAADDKARRNESIRLAAACWQRVSRISPVNCVMHIPYTAPTLAPVPGSYFKAGEGENWGQWLDFGFASLEKLERELGWSDRLLVENINFSPAHLVPLLKSGLCGLCLDFGHLVLGREDVSNTVKEVGSWIQEVHLHGVQGYTDHLGLDTLPEPQVLQWIKALCDMDFSGVMNLEVFSAGELERSLTLVEKAVHALNLRAATPAKGRDEMRFSSCGRG